MKVKVSSAEGPVLNWMVAKAKGYDIRNNACVWFLPFEAESDDLLQFICMADDTEHAREQCEDAYPNCTVDHVEYICRFEPSTNWSQGGPIIEKNALAVTAGGKRPIAWQAWIPNGHGHRQPGPTPLIAAMRCYVASKLGEEVEVPDELI